MVKKGSPKDKNEKYWKAQIEKQIRNEYQDYLDLNGKRGSPDNAHLFALEKIQQSGGFNYQGYNASEIIMLLEDKLPDFY